MREIGLQSWPKQSAQLFHLTDTANHEQVRALAAAAVARFGRIDIWHNNAFAAIFKPIHEQSLDEFDTITAVGIRGYWLGAKVAVEQMRAQGGPGVILNTASVQSFVGEKGFSAYQVTKGAVLALTRSLAVDHAPLIRAVAIAPGLVATDAVKGIATCPELQSSLTELTLRSADHRMA